MLNYFELGTLNFMITMSPSEPPLNPIPSDSLRKKVRKKAKGKALSYIKLTYCSMRLAVSSTPRRTVSRQMS